MAIDDQIFYTARVLKSLGFSIEQIAKEEDLNFQELSDKFKSMDYSPRDELEDGQRQTLVDIADLINNEKKRDKGRDNKLILEALKFRSEMIEKMARIKEDVELWTVEKLKQKIPEFKTEGKISQVFECLKVMGFEGLDFDTVSRKLSRGNMGIIAKIVGCDFNTVQSALYRIKVNGWDYIKKNKGLEGFLDKGNKNDKHD